MAFLSNKEFGELIGKSAQYINVQVGRGNLVRSGKLLDDTLPKNKAWLDKMRVKLGLAPKPAAVSPTPMPETAPPPPPIAAPVVPTTEFIPAVPSVPGGGHVADSNPFALEQEKKRLEVEKVRQEIRVKRAQAEKLEGALIPTEVVGSIIREMSESMKIAYLEALETYTVVVSAEHKLSTKQVAKIKGHFTTIINDTLKKQVAAAKKSLENVVAEYSETRGKGERRT